VLAVRYAWVLPPVPSIAVFQLLTFWPKSKALAGENTAIPILIRCCSTE